MKDTIYIEKNVKHNPKVLEIQLQLVIERLSDVRELTKHLKNLARKQDLTEQEKKKVKDFLNVWIKVAKDIVSNLESTKETLEHLEKL